MRSRRRAAAVAVAALLAVSCGAGADGDSASPTASRRTPSSTTTEPAADPAVSSRPAPSTTSAPTTTTTTAPPEPPEPPTLERGDEGPDVQVVQARLEALRYWVGKVDGQFGGTTEQAVYAFQKAHGLSIDGVVGPQVEQALTSPQPIVPKSGQGAVFEVDTDRQLLLYVVDGQVTWAWNTSTGNGQPFTSRGQQRLANTPTGEFKLRSEFDDGWQDGPLGALYRPKYFETSRGIAIHGSVSVPPAPASHGCVRLTVAAMDFLWANGLAPMGTAVMVYGDRPAPA